MKYCCFSLSSRLWFDSDFPYSVTVTAWKVSIFGVILLRILRISPCSVRTRENANQNNSEYGHILRSVSYADTAKINKSNGETSAKFVIETIEKHPRTLFLSNNYSLWTGLYLWENTEMQYFLKNLEPAVSYFWLGT